MCILYNAFINVVTFLFYLISWVKPKWQARAKGLLSQKINHCSSSRIWFHCASAGEFEQIADLLPFFQKKFPEHPILVSFYSASGIEWIRRKQLPYETVYLPFDRKRRMKHFINAVQPKCLVIAKNEFWPNMLRETKKQNIPVFMVSAKVTSNFIGLRSTCTKKILQGVTTIYTQDVASEDLLSKVHPSVKTTGDTRISRIYGTQHNRQKSIDIPFTIKRPIIIYGSLHKEDHGVLSSLDQLRQYNHVIVPHEVHPQSIRYFSTFLGPNPPLLSSNSPIDSNVVIVDTIGKLATLYEHSIFAYVGGGFSKGIHNIIEPLIHRNIVCIGPNHQSFEEAKTLSNLGAIEVINSPKEFVNSLKKVLTLGRNDLEKKHNIATAFIQSHRYASEKVAEDIMRQLR